MNDFYKFMASTSKLARQGIFILLSVMGVMLIVFALWMKSGIGDPLIIQSRNLSTNEFLTLIFTGSILPIIGCWLNLEITRQLSALPSLKRKEEDAEIKEVSPVNQVSDFS